MKGIKDTKGAPSGSRPKRQRNAVDEEEESSEVDEEEESSEDAVDEEEKSSEDAVDEEEESSEDAVDEEEESSEGEPSVSRTQRVRNTLPTINQRGGAQTINTYGRSKVKGNTITGSVVNVYTTATEKKGTKVRKDASKGCGKKRPFKDSSPGPSTSNKKKKKDTKVTDSVIEALAEDIGINPKLGKLGLKLGFGFSAMKIYKAKNHADGDVTCEGTQEMLINWRDEGQGKASILKKALIDSGLRGYADKYFEGV